MKIYFDGSVYYTRERFLSMVRSNAKYIVDPTTTYYSNNNGYSKESIKVDDLYLSVFRPEQLEDDEIIYLLSHNYGGFIKENIAEELAKAFGLESGYTLTKTTEIEVKE